MAASSSSTTSSSTSAFNMLSKKVHDTYVPVFVESASWVAWLGAEEVVHLLRLPLSSLQSIPARHRKCWTDFRNNCCGGNGRCDHHCRWDGGKILVDVFGLSVLCGKINSTVSDYLMTLFIAEIYKELCDCWDRCRPDHCHPPPPPPPPPPDHCRPPPTLPYELLDRLSRQSDLIVNAVNQLSITNSNQHLEISNQLNAIRLQNTTLTGQLSSVLEILDTQLNGLTGEVGKLLAELDGKFDTLLSAVNSAFAQLQDSVRHELTNINAILNNLTSSVTNINATINNLLQAVQSLNLSKLDGELNEIQSTLDQIHSILTPDIPLQVRTASS